MVDGQAGREPPAPKSNPNRSKIKPTTTSKTTPESMKTQSWAFWAAGRAQVGFRRAPGLIRQSFWLIFEIDFDVKSYSDIQFFASAFFVGTLVLAHDSD